MIRYLSAWRRTALAACVFAAGLLLPPSAAAASLADSTSPTVRSVAAQPVPASSGEPSRTIAEMERAVFRRINAIRREHGLDPLERNQTLARIAHRYSCRMAQEDFFSHEAPSGQTVVDRVRQAGLSYRRVGENIARNTNAANPVRVTVRGWMNSPGHRRNILNERFTETGVGVCRDGNRYYFTQVFLRPPAPGRGLAPTPLPSY